MKPSEYSEKGGGQQIQIKKRLSFPTFILCNLSLKIESIILATTHHIFTTRHTIYIAVLFSNDNVSNNGDNDNLYL